MKTVGPICLGEEDKQGPATGQEYIM